MKGKNKTVRLIGLVCLALATLFVVGIYLVGFIQEARGNVLKPDWKQREVVKGQPQPNKSVSDTPKAE